MLPSDLEDARRIVELIRVLTQDEGDEVRIYYDNPEFGGPNCRVDVTHEFSYAKIFFGDSVLKCLEQAKRERERHGNKLGIKGGVD